MTKSKKTVEENESLQEDLRDLQLKQDVGQTLGPDERNPCKNQLIAYHHCENDQKKNSFLDCKDYLENLQKCYEFWAAVQDYRVNVLKKSDLELPRGEEYKKWQKKMPDWYLSKKLSPPEDL